METKFTGFNKHPEIEGQHAFLGASKYQWLNYDEEKLAQTYINSLAVIKGTETHKFARLCIERRQKLPSSKLTLNMYVNDAIGFNMIPEQPLLYSWNCYGTCDAISFSKNTLRIHDLKTGSTPASMNQLKIYAAFFCMEYNINPTSIKIILRIYQNNEYLEETPEGEEILIIMDKIAKSDILIEKIKQEVN